MYKDSNSNINTMEEEFIVDEGIPRKIKSQATTPSIQSLYQDWKDGDLVISPSFQRNFVWNNKKASNLIESILLNIPLPIIFTATTEGKEEVIDGQQRLTSIFSFIDGHFPDGSKFKLQRNLKILSDKVGGKTFANLDKEFQKTIKKYPLFVVSISEESQEEVKFEMFERLNTNITKLNAQELRNCLYRGAYNSFLQIMAKDKDFQKIINKPTYKRRMSDVELVLMFCAFHNTSPELYRKSLVQFLNDELKINKKITAEQITNLEKQFKKSVQLIKHIWDDTAFNMYSIDNKSKQVTRSSTFNQGLYQILTYWFIPYEKHQVIPYADLIREELMNLQIHSHSFRDTLTGSGTNSPHNIKLKFDIWGNTIKGILNYPKNEPRSFSYELKDQLFKQNNTCQICGQKIRAIDDAEVDHIICYWKGGKTIPENARLVHRYCNRQRGYSDDISSENSNENSINSKITTFEEELRLKIAELLIINNCTFQSNIPDNVKNKISMRLKDHIAKHPYDKDAYDSLEQKFVFCDIFDYFKIIKHNWKIFSVVFVSRENLEKHVQNLNELRNNLRHSRVPNNVTLKNGEAAIEWFNSILKL